MANINQQQQGSISGNDNNINSRTDNQPSAINIGNNFLNQSMVDFESLLEIPLFNELMLVYEIQYNATKDALKHFLEEQPSLILPLFTNVVWSLLVNPLLTINPIANFNFSSSDLPISNENLQIITDEILHKIKTNNSMQNAFNSQQCNQNEHNQLNDQPDKRTRKIHRAENVRRYDANCKFTFYPLTLTFIKHRRRHLGISELAFACGTCDKRCSERRHLAVHCKNKHHEMPSIPSKPVLRSNSEQDVMIISAKDSKEESPNLAPELNSMNEKIFVKLWQADDRSGIPNGMDMCNQS